MQYLRLVNTDDAKDSRLPLKPHYVAKKHGMVSFNEE